MKTLLLFPSFAFIAATAAFSADTEITIQDPEHVMDIWMTSVYSYGDDYGVNDGRLRVGGWGDYYHSLLRFDLDSVPAGADVASARLLLFNYGNDGGTNVTMNLDRVVGPWDESTGWYTAPATEYIRTVSKPAVGSWYELDVTDLVQGWVRGDFANFGLQLRPTSVNHQFNDFHSSDYADDPSLRPKLILTLQAGETVPVVFIPGIGGTELEPASPLHVEKAWPTQALKHLGGDVALLQFDQFGQPANNDSLTLETPSLVTTVFGHVVYGWEDGIKEALESSGRTVVPFPYDFRYSPQRNAIFLHDVIEHLCPNPGDKVDIVAHSMGGLVALDYAQRYQAAKHRVRRFVSLGTPYLGAPRAFQALRAGWNLGDGHISANYIKRMGHNWPGLFSLLPSLSLQSPSALGSVWAYFDTPSAAYLTFLDASLFQDTLATRDEPAGPDFNPLTSEDPQPQAWLSGILVDQAFDYFATRDAAGLPAEIETLVVAGYHLDSQGRALPGTPRRFFEYPLMTSFASDASGQTTAQSVEWHYLLTYGAGDGTVPMLSQEIGVSDA